MQLRSRFGEPLPFAAQRAAVAVLWQRRKGTQALGSGQAAFGQFMHGGVDDAGVGFEEFGAVDPDFAVEHFPDFFSEQAVGAVASQRLP